jgi:hypothetical protein
MPGRSAAENQRGERLGNDSCRPRRGPLANHPRWYIRPLWAAAALLALAGAAANDFLLLTDTPISLVTVLELYLSALFFACMVCHGELARLKPNPRYLTEFYLLIAAGGALGGLFAAVVAPLLFSTYYPVFPNPGLSYRNRFGLQSRTSRSLGTQRLL